MALIDLDQVPAGDGPPPRRRFARSSLGAMCLVLVVLLGGAARLPSARLPVIIPAELTDTAFLQGDELYVTRSVDSGRQQRLEVYRLPAIRKIAAYTIPVIGPLDQVVQVGDVYLIQYRDNSRGGVGELVAFGATSGRVLWHVEDVLFGYSSAAGVALLVNDERTVAVDLHTGAERWSVPVGGFVADSNGDGLPLWLLVVNNTDRVTVYDGSTGAVVAVGDVPEIRTLNALAFADSARELVISTTGGRVGAYALPSLTRRWAASIDVPSGSGAVNCGTAICFRGQQLGLTVLDPATGRVIWTSDRWNYVGETPGSLLVTTAPGDLGASPLTALDPATGRVRGDLGGWRYITTVDGSGPRYVEHPTGVRNEMLFGEVNWQRLTVRVVGVGEDISDNCQASADIVMCRLADASVAVWRLR